MLEPSFPKPCFGESGERGSPNSKAQARLSAIGHSPIAWQFPQNCRTPYQKSSTTFTRS